MQKLIYILLPALTISVLTIPHASTSSHKQTQFFMDNGLYSEQIIDRPEEAPSYEDAYKILDAFLNSEEDEFCQTVVKHNGKTYQYFKHRTHNQIPAELRINAPMRLKALSGPAMSPKYYRDFHKWYTYGRFYYLNHEIFGEGWFLYDSITLAAQGGIPLHKCWPSKNWGSIDYHDDEASDDNQSKDG